MTNRVCQALGIKYPIIQGAMQWVSDASLVASVSEAGGFGVLASADAQKENIRVEIKKVKRATTKPFAVNITIISQTAKDILDVAIEEKVPFVVLTAGNPKPFIPLLKEAGIAFLSVVATVKQAIKMEELGASVIVVEGQEAGGHIGEMTSMTFIPQAVAAVNVPIVAAGGIATGHGMAAAFALGAEGIQMGTAFMVSQECTIHQNVKDALIQADSGDSVVTGRKHHHAVRCIANELTKAFATLDEKNAPVEDYAAIGKGATYKASREGDVIHGSVMAGQIVGLVNSEKTTAEIIQDTIAEYNTVIRQLLEMS
ncbi:MAG: nitronate monooxygenase [Defluviitaleaceae bacterium]|nr:nitronate monooxygenase [Defluviitaleaceae bacterium]